MIHYTIEKLISGDSELIEWYRIANKKWEEIFNCLTTTTPEELAEILSARQIGSFEKNCGGRSIGQEIMVAVGFGRLYTTQDGFGKNKKKAILVKKAFARSLCSLEVKFYAKQIAKDYGLED